MNKKIAPLSPFHPLTIACAGLAFLFTAHLASAQTVVAVPNSSFETPSAAGFPFQFQDNTGLAAGSAIPGTGWFYLGGYTGDGSPVGVENTGANSGSIGGDGVQNAYVNAGASMGSGALLTIDANTTYTLTVAEARRGGGFAQTGGFNIGLGYGTTPGATPTFAAGARQFFALPATIGVFSDYSVSFTTGSTGSGDAAIGQSLFVVLGSELINGVDNPVDFDNVRVTATAVPEPSSMVLFAAATGMGLLMFRRKMAAA